MTRSRLPLLDAMKGIGCVAIVLHHLAVYGPMSDVVRSAFPAVIDGLEIYARLAVQMFFVLAGFLVAAQLAPEGQPSTSSATSALSLILKRYRRLVTPFLFAIASAILITAIVRPWFVHDSLSAPPSLAQLLAHTLLLHDLTGVEALSAGVWYVAIDFQLFILTVWLTAFSARVVPTWRWVFPCLIMALAAASLWAINRHNQYEDYAPYFFGAYALGMLAYWSTRNPSGGIFLLTIAALGSVALWLQYRNPIVVALATAIIVAIAGQRGWLALWPRPGLLTWLGQRSYSIFLIHYGFCIGMNALWARLFPTGVFINAVGMMLAVLISVGAGTLLYRYVESQPNALGRNWVTAVLGAAIATAFLLETLVW
ncbi:MAG: acyltransferase [Candidatus Methylopumilus sp.]|nr:acyltransferase [Candidatus Methylopumilus sp.]